MNTCTITYVYPLDWLRVTTQIVGLVAMCVVLVVAVALAVSIIRRKPQPQITVVNNAPIGPMAASQDLKRHKSMNR